MAFTGYLLYLGEAAEPFPNELISMESYNIAPHQRQDIDSGLNGNYHLLRNVAEHTRSKIEFCLPLGQDSVSLPAIYNRFARNFTNSKERQLKIRYYDPETDTYHTGLFYRPDITYAIKRIDTVKNQVIYAAVKITLIEY